MEQATTQSIETEFKYPWYTKLYFSWLVLSALYLAIVFTTNYLNPDYTLSGVGAWVGLFVPFGVWNTIVALGGLGRGGNPITFSVIPVFLLALFYFDRQFVRFQLSPWLKILANLVFLFLFTLVIDFIFWGGWVSWRIVQNMGLELNF